MRHALITCIFLAFSSASLLAQEPEQPNEPLIPGDTLSELFNWFTEDGERLFHDFLTEIGPQLEALRDQVQDWTLYEAPEVLENGDIIIRRKQPKEGEELPEGTREI